MTLRWMDLVEQQIQHARARGLFDRLKGRGKPIEHDDLADLPAEARIEARIATSVGGAPPEVERMAQVDRLRAELARASDEETRRSLRRALRDAEIERNVLLERTGRAILLNELLDRERARHADDDA